MNSDRRQFLARSIAILAACGECRTVFAGDRRPSEFVETPCAIIQLPNGRRLAYADYGDPNASRVIIHHHGFSSCRLELRGYREILIARPGLRMIAFDRPGIGRSDADPCGTFLSWSADLANAADALGIKSFAVMAVSGGAPYALAAARAMPDRVTRASIACPMAPLEAVNARDSAGARGAILAHRHPRIAELALRRSFASLCRNPNSNPGGLFTMSPADREVMADPVVQKLSRETTIEAYHQGPSNMVRAAAALAEPWACWLREIRQKVTIFQGCADRITAPAMAQYLVRALPNAEARFFPGEGHMSMGVRFRSEFVLAACGSN